jgi:hypothetical protein
MRALSISAEYFIDLQCGFFLLVTWLPYVGGLFFRPYRRVPGWKARCEMAEDAAMVSQICVFVDGARRKGQERGLARGTNYEREKNAEKSGRHLHARKSARTQSGVLSNHRDSIKFWHWRKNSENISRYCFVDTKTVGLR